MEPAMAKSNPTKPFVENIPAKIELNMESNIEKLNTICVHTTKSEEILYNLNRNIE